MEPTQIGMDIADLCLRARLCKSKSEARKQIKNGGIKVQDIRITDPFARVVLDREKNQIFIVEKNKQEI